MFVSEKERQAGRRAGLGAHAAFCLCCSGAAGGNDGEHNNSFYAVSECISTHSSQNHRHANTTVN